MEMAHRKRVPNVAIHALLDGRDTPPSSALGFLVDLERRLATAHAGAAIASVGGRYFAMDRDNRWDRIERGYDAIVHREALHHASSATTAIEAAYARGETDEFVAPTIIDGHEGPIHDHDPIIHANFRADRARQLTHSLADGGTFVGFDRTSPSGRRAPASLFIVTMTAYEAGLPVQAAFPPEEARSLAQAFSEAGWRQFHVAETEKYAHVTYFFNGGREAPFPGEERLLIPSPNVATYDLAPAMSAVGVTDALVNAIGSGQYDFIVANYANADMVGHTGNLVAATRAIEVLDACIGRVAIAVRDAGGEMLITADHGNAEKMRDEATGQAHTAHTLNRVPCIYVGRSAVMANGGALQDIAPTLLAMLGLPPPSEMTGRSLITFRGSPSE